MGADGYFDPLPRVLVANDFKNGMTGWLDLRPNFVQPGFAEHSQDIDLIHWGPTMLSSATFAFGGTHGSAQSTYSLKISSRTSAAPADQPPASGSMGLAIERPSVPPNTLCFRIEGFFAYKVEQDRPGPGVDDLRSFGLFVDLQDSKYRCVLSLRYVNAVGGASVRCWQFYSQTESTDAEWSFANNGWHKAGINPQWFGERAGDGLTAATSWFPCGTQNLVYNESDDKLNWMQLALTFNLEMRSYEEFRVGARTFRSPERAAPTLSPTCNDIQGVLSPVFFAEAGTDRRVSLFLDSVLIPAKKGAAV
jgi:hypothetical protein